MSFSGKSTKISKKPKALLWEKIRNSLHNSLIDIFLKFECGRE